MTKPARVEGLSIYRGNKFVFTARFWTDAAKTTADDVSGREFVSQLRPFTDSEDADDLDVDMDNAATGLVVFSIAKEVTADMTLGVRVLDVEDLTNDVTLFRADVLVEGDVTREDEGS